MLKKLARGLLPPFLVQLLSLLLSTFRRKRADRLFDGDDALFRRVVAGATTYGEYGCGDSTVWVARHTGCRILGVDSSRAWIEQVAAQCPGTTRLALHHADLGPVGDWGRPLGYDREHNFPDYTDWLWTQDEKPDVVLVDGRFRVCCFLTCLLHARAGTRILFDDYGNRPYYQVVERFLAPVESCGRQVLFIVPDREQLDLPRIREARDRFRLVMD